MATAQSGFNSQEYDIGDTLSSEQGFLVRIAPSGKIVNVVNWDGSEVRYAPEEKKRITDARLAFLKQGKKGPDSFLKNVNGKWQKEVWRDEVSQREPNVGMDDVAQGITVHVGPEGNILRVTNFDGSEVQYSESIDFTNARIATTNYCCYRSCGVIACCLCQYCPWGCR